jgi:serine/threonine protein kinase/tetratricopeptide (TPR) repeat protein
MRSCPQCQSACDDSHKFCPSCGFPIGKVVANSEDPLIGRTLPGGYVILDLVGIGGMGRVYRAEQTNLARTVAVKIIHPHLVGEENAAARFITEARAASRLNHPNSVGVIDFGKTPDGQLYLVMEFLRGRDLARVSYEEGPLPFRRIVDVLRQVLAALSEAHHLEIIHRDLKPENIILEPMRTGGDFVKVVDFGLAKMRQESTGPSITSPGIVCGTPEYMSPEQGRGDPLDARSDLYAVGVILFQLLTGRLPFEADSPTQVVLMHLTTPPPDPRKIAPDRMIAEPLVEVVLKALSKEQRDRHRNADEFAEALVTALAHIEGPSSLPLADRVSTLKCPTCGALNAPTQKFCGDCGAPTMVSAATPFAERDTAPPARPSTRSEISTVTRKPNIDGTKITFPLAFIGREDDLAWLEERRNEAKVGLVAARILGDPGMGKTRLLEEFLAACSAADDIVVQTGPDPTWAEVGYYALRVAIRALANLPDDGGVERQWIAASAEARRGIADIFEKPDNASSSSVRLSPEERRFAAAEALRWALTRASEQGRGHRVLFAVDDIQNVDGASRNALADVVCEPPLAPVLLIAASPPSFDPGWPAIARASRTLGGLPTALVAKVVTATGVPSPSFSGGRGIAPLYLDQAIRFGREHGGQPPARLADLIALRVERLPADARRVLQAVAVLGDATAEMELLPLLPAGLDLVEALALLRRSGMIESSPGGWRVAHPLAREVILATIPALVRRELHALAAKNSEANRTSIEVQALHEYYAHNAFDALILLEKVSSRCSARGDIAGTILALRRGLELARRELFRGELDDPMRAVLIFGRKLGEALAQAGDYMDAEGVLREALDMAGPSGPDRARVLGALAHVAFGRDRRLEAQVYLREAMELANRSGTRELVTSLEKLKRQIAV